MIKLENQHKAVFHGNMPISIRKGTAAASAGSNILFQDDFESGDLSNWSVDNDSINAWHVGQAVSKNGSYSAYISQDSGASATYDSSDQDSHMWFDIDVPSNATSLTLSFWFLAKGEPSGYYDDRYDFGYIMYKPTTFTPVDGVKYNSSTDKADRIGAESNDGQFDDDYVNASATVWYNEVITIDSNDQHFNAGSSQRIIFSWSDDGSLERNPAFCIDDVLVTFNTD